MRRHRLLQTAPWLTDAAATNAWVADRKYITTTTGNTIDPGAFAAEKGGVNFGTSAMQFDTGFAGRPLGYVHPGTTGFLSADFLASAVSGTNQPFSLFFSCHINTSPTALYMWMFARSVGGNPLYQCTFTGTNQDVECKHRNDAGSIIAGGHISLGSTPVIFSFIFDGTNLNTYLNQTQVDTNVAFGRTGATTLDWFTIFAARSNGTHAGDSDFRLRRFVFRPGAAPSAELRKSYVSFMMREAGL